MNRPQKAIIIIAVFCVAAMVLFPPWVLRRGTRTIAGPYALLWIPPKGDYVTACFIDLYRLSAQFIGLLVITAGLCLVLRTPKKGEEKNE